MMSLTEPPWAGISGVESEILQLQRPYPTQGEGYLEVLQEGSSGQVLFHTKRELVGWKVMDRLIHLLYGYTGNDHLNGVSKGGIKKTTNTLTGLQSNLFSSKSE